MDHLPHITRNPETEEEWFKALIDLARYLRSPEGCPWDQKQTARSFANFAREEAQELVEAIDEDDNPHVAEEFGDTLFTLLASAAAAEAEGRFRLDDALRGAHEKMIRRHDHVFGGDKAATEEEAWASWHRIKAEEKKGRS
jgi:tetrapyrrole methylase family protein/MazG family protein